MNDPTSPRQLVVRVIDHSAYGGLIGDFGGALEPPAFVPSSMEDALAEATVTASVPFDRDAVLALVGELTSPRAQFLARARALALELAPADDGTAEGFLRRELFLGYTASMAEFDADMLFGEGRELVGILGDSGKPELFGA